jgi:hypothetical protein
VEISYIFALNGAVATAAALFSARWSRRVWERTILLTFQIGNTLTIGALSHGR